MGGDIRQVLSAGVMKSSRGGAMPSSIDVGLKVSKGLEHSLLKIFWEEVGDDSTMLRLDSKVTESRLFLRYIKDLGYQFGAFTTPQLEELKSGFKYSSNRGEGCDSVVPLV